MDFHSPLGAILLIVGNLKLKQTTYGLTFYITGVLKNYELKKFHKTSVAEKLCRFNSLEKT